MKAIRVVAVGFLLASGVMLMCSQAFFSYWLTNESLSSWLMALHALSPNAASAVGFGALPVIIFVFISTGLGLLISSTVYSKFEDTLRGFLSSPDRLGAGYAAPSV